jgi:hypothetical protein
MGRRLLRVLVVMAMVIVTGVLAVPASAVTGFRIFVLDSLVPNGWTEAAAINNGDIVVGSVDSPAGQRAVRWDRWGGGCRRSRPLRRRWWPRRRPGVGVDRNRADRA